MRDLLQVLGQNRRPCASRLKWGWGGGLEWTVFNPRLLSFSLGPLLSWFSSCMETAIKAYKPQECGGGVCVSIWRVEY